MCDVRWLHFFFPFRMMCIKATHLNRRQHLVGVTGAQRCCTRRAGPFDSLRHFPTPAVRPFVQVRCD